MRTPLSEMHERRSKPLHRTLPCWSRKVRDGGDVEWTLYVPHRMGGAVYVIESFGRETPREQVAAVLRQRRRMLWGRDRVADEKPAKGRAAVRDEIAPATPAHVDTGPDAIPHGSVASDDAQVGVEPLSLVAREPAAGDDLPPWREDDVPGEEPDVYAADSAAPEPVAQAQLGFAF